MSPIPEKVKRCKSLIRLENGANRVLFNPNGGKPLLVESGADLVRAFLSDVEQHSSSSRLLSDYVNGLDLLRLMLDHRVIVDAVEEEHVPDPATLANALGGDRQESSLYLLVSQFCNLNCIYCLNGEKTYARRSNPKMSEDVAFVAIERCLQNTAVGGFLQIVFFGGEPLLNWRLIKACVRHYKEELQQKYQDREVIFHLTTNLSFLPADLIPFATENAFSFLVDIDGPPQYHNLLRPFIGGGATHTAITDNVRRLLDSGLNVELRATITGHNVDAMPEIAAHHFELGGNATAMVPVTPVNSDGEILAPEMYPDPDRYVSGLWQIYENGPFPAGKIFPINDYRRKLQSGAVHCLVCGAPYGNVPAVTVEGDAYPCIYWVGVDRLKMFNIFQDIDQAQFQERGRRLIETLHVDNLADCSKCEWRYLCGGGCPVHRIMLDPVQEYYQEASTYAQAITCHTVKGLFSRLLWQLAGEEAERLTAHRTLPRVPSAEELWPEFAASD